MNTKNIKGVPRNFREQPAVREAYDEGGRSIGRAILHNPEQEEYFWSLLKGLDLWPRWYLSAFKKLYCDENPREHRASIKNRYQRKKRRKERLVQWEQENRRATDLTAQPSIPRPTEDTAHRKAGPVKTTGKDARHNERP